MTGLRWLARAKEVKIFYMINNQALLFSFHVQYSLIVLKLMEQHTAVKVPVLNTMETHTVQNMKMSEER